MSYHYHRPQIGFYTIYPQIMAYNTWLKLEMPSYYFINLIVIIWVAALEVMNRWKVAFI